MTNDSTPTRVGFIGLGAMGVGMAANIAEAYTAKQLDDGQG